MPGGDHDGKALQTCASLFTVTIHDLIWPAIEGRFDEPTATLRLCYRRDHSFEPGEHVSDLALWLITIEAANDAGDLVANVGYLRIWQLRQPEVEPPFDLLDSVDDDLGYYASLFAWPDLDYEDALPVAWPWPLTIVAMTWVNEPYRGRGIGPFAASVAVRELAYEGVVAAFASASDQDLTEAAKTHQNTSIENILKTLGATYHPAGLYLLGVETGQLDDAVELLGQRVVERQGSMASAPFSDRPVNNECR